MELFIHTVLRTHRTKITDRTRMLMLASEPSNDNQPHTPAETQQHTRAHNKRSKDIGTRLYRKSQLRRIHHCHCCIACFVKTFYTPPKKQSLPPKQYSVRDVLDATLREGLDEVDVLNMLESQAVTRSAKSKTDDEQVVDEDRKSDRSHANALVYRRATDVPPLATVCLT